MRHSVILAAIGLAACSGEAERSHALLMQKIEATVRLPKGAAQLERYNRYYAMNGPVVIAIYIRADMAAAPKSAPEKGVSRWVGDKRGLPNYSDGGCDIVDLVYDPATQTFSQISCQGEA